MSHLIIIIIHIYTNTIWHLLNCNKNGLQCIDIVKYKKLINSRLLSFIRPKIQVGAGPFSCRLWAYVKRTFPI